MESCTNVLCLEGVGQRIVRTNDRQVLLVTLQ